jgi:hypothetical protein
MPRLAPTLLLLALAGACDRVSDPMDVPSTGGPVLDAASKAVDPSALTPAPQLVGATAECRADGRWIVCHTLLELPDANAPIFDLPCGTVYETASDVRHGIRWYDASDSVLVKRHVTDDADGTWRLSPSGAGPTVQITAHGNWYDSQYADLDDLDSGVGAAHGMFTVSAPGFGVIAHIAGRDATDDVHRGTFRPIEDPAVAAGLCAALTR